MQNYPETATERFDNANFHIKYCLSIIKKYIKGDVLKLELVVVVLQELPKQRNK